MLINEAIELFDNYLCAKGDTERTRLTYRQRLTALFAYLKAVELGHVKPEGIDKWVADMRKRELSPVTIRNRVGDTRSFFRFCVERRYMEHSPVAHLRIKKVKILTAKNVSSGDLQKMVNLARETNRKRDLAILLFIAETGCRAGETARLESGNLDLANYQALVKGKVGERYVCFGLAAKTALLEWLQVHPCPGEYVFVNRFGEPIRPDTIYQAFKRLACEAGIKGRFNPHGIRHLVGQVWAEQTNLEITREKLGHSDIATTVIYAPAKLKHIKAAQHRVKIL